MLEKWMVGGESVAECFYLNDLTPRTYPIGGLCNHSGILNASPHLGDRK
jgi:hypothetical protein